MGSVGADADPRQASLAAALARVLETGGADKVSIFSDHASGAPTALRRRATWTWHSSWMGLSSLPSEAILLCLLGGSAFETAFSTLPATMWHPCLGASGRPCPNPMARTSSCATFCARFARVSCPDAPPPLTPSLAHSPAHVTACIFQCRTNTTRLHEREIWPSK